MVSVLTDVTKQRELDRLKSDFVSNVTHELRTPIVAIQHSLGVMLNQVAGAISEPQKNFLTIAQRNLDRLGSMINDLLDLAKLEAHKMELKREQTSIRPIIQRVCETLEAWAKSKVIRLEQRLPDQLPELFIDSMKIEQVLNNLIGNAIKFTPKNGAVTVEVQLGKDGKVEISVVDTGVGITLSDQSRVFDRFYRGEHPLVLATPGTGLGLSIVKELVEMHKGRIWVQSTGVPGEGSTFSFTLPVYEKQ